MLANASTLPAGCCRPPRPSPPRPWAAARWRRPPGPRKPVKHPGRLPGRLDARPRRARRWPRRWRKALGPAGGGREQARCLGQHRRRPGGQGHRRSHAGRRHQRQPDLGQAAQPEAALRPGDGLQLRLAAGDGAAGAGGAAGPARGRGFFAAARKAGRQVELRLGGHRLGRPSRHGVRQGAGRQLRGRARALQRQPGGHHRHASAARSRWR